ncbi:uncharacterized protein LOC127610427 isoform X2 [Hippocampus zosterae]|uniref:uncharacterized protein LOC127610427 isoform X2 n=1 Tax=Hippocampus zosterae TaxID=109293 RepID=UPI00223CFD4F|nr:uncharacterized protein LOC127610427 isoform X2 [Hippocampus zosterae]
MEPNILTYQHPAARPSLDDEIRVAQSDEEEFRGFSCGLPTSADPLFHLKRNFLRQGEPPGGPALPLTNGFCESPGGEVGFADFAVFAEQATHPWCCSFTGATTPLHDLKEARDVIMDSEPRSSNHRLDLRTQDNNRMSPAAEDQDCVSLERPSDDSEPYMSSCASHRDHTDDDDDDDHMVEDGCASSQGTCPTSKQSSQSCADNSGDPPGLPLSESFADFCSATTQQDGAEKWPDFKDQNDHMQQVGSVQLLQASFPEIEVPAVSKEEEEEEDVPSLEALLPQRRPEYAEDTVEGGWPGFWLPHQDAHCAASLKFWWGTSHTNRTLLGCLGVVSGNMEPRKDSYPGHTETTYKAQTHTHRPFNQLSAKQPRA